MSGAPHPPLAFAAVSAGDLEEMAELEAALYVDYREFAPAGWRPPARDQELAMLRRWIAEPCFEGVLARDGAGRLVGHVTFIPACAHSRLPVADAALAHIGQLFVAREHWGTGLAGELLARAARRARELGFTRIRLYVVAAHGRARRFYEREGFAKTAEAGDIGLGLVSLEYRREL